ncbi:MAG TPA: hypothetical protein VD997_15065 [Phycisphaerales bacterium]|nr:hypothetical protein [Phycisphaerales bacterium]
MPGRTPPAKPLESCLPVILAVIFIGGMFISVLYYAAIEGFLTTLLLVAVLIVLPGGGVLLFAWHTAPHRVARRRLASAACPECGYDRHAAPANAPCPECGTTPDLCHHCGHYRKDLTRADPCPECGRVPPPP